MHPGCGEQVRGCGGTASAQRAGGGGTHQRQLRVEAQAHVDEDVRGVRHFRLAVHLRLEGCRVWVGCRDMDLDFRIEGLGHGINAGFRVQSSGSGFTI
jgi:hypothetical protein